MKSLLKTIRSREFPLYFGVIVGLANTLVMLWTLYNIYITDNHFIKAEVMVGEPNIAILLTEAALCIIGIIMMSQLLFNYKKFSIGVK